MVVNWFPFNAVSSICGTCIRTECNITYGTTSGSNGERAWPSLGPPLLTWVTASGIAIVKTSIVTAYFIISTSNDDILIYFIDSTGIFVRA
jgi:hypothetical protein